MSTSARAGSWGAFGALILVAMIAGCATTREPFTIAPISVTETPVRKIAKPVAFFHSQAFRETLRAVEPWGNQLYLPLKTGEASDHALRAAYQRLFDSAHEVASLEAFSGVAGPGSALGLIEPKEVRVDYLDASGRGWGPFYSRASYRFSFSDATGKPIADWRVRGFAQYDSSSEPRLPGEFQTFAEAPRRAIAVSVANFIRGFERVPELVRWSRDLPVTQSNAPASGQMTRENAEGVEVRHPGVLTLQVRRAPLPKPPADLVREETAAPALLALRLTLRNESPRRLSLDPGEVEWVVTGANTLEPLPASIVSAHLSGRPFGMAVGVMSPGVGMLPALFAALATASSGAEHQQRLAAWTAATGREILKDDVTPTGEIRGGLIYLAQPPNREGGELIVRVIDLDDAVRYSLRVPLPAR